ncbi:CRISPR-associated protein [Nostoc sp. T09]|uniref:RAMP superfamily CRISPR-associated protein n=1 Tax=Nostoc sp. T09 TaxID=1932621 RepID=UPI000A3D5B46|nr:RAMP superfamily CRISPR-associated protein [Nostoc sp. T09]OUL18673.1 CRISPR-associated protein [Nostoc sp. T09]
MTRTPSNPSQQAISPKPYKLVSLPSQPPNRQRPAGQDRFRQDRLSGKMSLRLTVQTNTVVASGAIALGIDVLGLNKNSPNLIKTAVRRDRRLIIPGSSFKGVVRSAYEAITQSCLCKVTSQAKKQNWIPDNYQECQINQSNNKVCPACQVFGAMNWQGLIRFTDAICETTKFRVKFIPSLYQPQPEPFNQITKQKQLNSEYFSNYGKVRGRKFYYHALQAIDSGNRGIETQQAGIQYTFTTDLYFMNLSSAEIGTLLIVLGQDTPKHPIALKVGSGKPIGMGTMTVEVTAIEQPTNICDRYLSFQPEANQLTGEELAIFKRDAIKQAHETKLVQPEQLRQLSEVLKYPTNRQAPEGMY